MGDNDRRDGDEGAALTPLKNEVAKEIGVDPDRYGGNVPARTWGALGGHMVRHLIARGRRALADGRHRPHKSGPT